MTDEAPLIVRAMAPTGEPGDGKTLFGRIARANEWSEINSVSEGNFLERNAPGAFRKTLADGGSRIHILFQHGKDPEVGDKPIALPVEMGEDSIGAFYRGELFDGVPALVRDGLKAGVYGSSHQFRVLREDWERHPNKSDYNPKGLPERTIREAKVYEMGPVTWPAFGGSSAAVRSLTDQFLPTPDPVAPSDDAEQPLTSSERRDEPVEPTPVEPAPIAAPEPRSIPVPELNYEEKVARLSELKDAIARQATEYPGVMPVDAAALYEADKAEATTLERDVLAWEGRQADLARFAKREDNVDAGTIDRSYTVPNQINRKSEKDIYSVESRATTVEGRQAEYRDDAKRILELTTFNPALADQARSLDKLSYMLDLEAKATDLETGHSLAERIKYTGSPIYLRAFDKIIKAGGQTFGLTPEEQRGTALAVGVDGTGGFAVPFAFDPTVIAIGVNNGAVNPYRRAARVVSISGTDTWNALTATAVVATRTTEAAPAVEQGPTFAQPQYIVTRVQGQITASFEMFQDRTDLASEMGALIQEAKDNEEETSMAVGASAAANIGVGPVSGTSGAYTAVAGAGSGVLAAADFIATEAALPVRHRFNAQWFMNRVNIRKAQALETTGGQLFGGSQYPAVGNPAVDGAGNTGLRLLGYPVNESPSLPVATTTTITAATLCNVSSYVIVDRIGMSVQFIPFIFNSSALATGQQALYFLYRNTAKPINVDAGRTLRFL